MSNVKTNYVDYALKPEGSGNPKSLRKFETYNATTGALASTMYVKDVTDYATVGSNMLASDLNTIGNAVNSNSANFASEYSPSAIYAVNDYCTYQNVLYKCTAAITTSEAWNSAHWAAINSMDEFKQQLHNHLYVIERATANDGYATFTVPIDDKRRTLLIYGDGNNNPYCGVIMFNNQNVRTTINGLNAVLSVNAEIIGDHTLKITTLAWDLITIVANFVIS